MRFLSRLFPPNRVPGAKNEQLRSAVQSATRPSPPMPACKPPAEAVSNTDLMCEIKALREEMKHMRAELISADDWQLAVTTPGKGERAKGVMSSGASYQPTSAAPKPAQPPRKP